MKPHLFCSALFTTLLALLSVSAAAAAGSRRPNVLLAIADDQSFPLTSFAGYKAVNTPAFDRVAREGVYFKNGFAGSPGCSPSRAALLTGRHDWQIEEAGTHASSFPKRYIVFPDILEQAGYRVGLSGKGWGPGNWKISERPRNPAGNEADGHTLTPPARGISNKDYAANFKGFLARRAKDQPFYFWYGGHEPHRGYEKGSGLRSGKKLEDAVPPPFLPDSPEVRSDILDACLEIEWFDRHLGLMIKALEEAGELENTLIIVTADNGMPFPRAKANAYEHGIHVPLAIRWGAKVPGGRQIEDVVGFVDLTATILEATGTKHPNPSLPPSGRSIMNILTSRQQGLVDATRVAYSSRERHSSARFDNWTYPQRALRKSQYLYIRNFRPDRWPAGDPVVLKDDGTPESPHSGYKDIDGGPTLDFLIAKADDPKLGRFLQLAVAKRPVEELFDIKADPGCLKNLAADPKHAAAKAKLAQQLETTLRQTGDRRVLDGGDIWETYPRYSPIRKFPKPVLNRE
ncbi:MAG: sulfatase [Opitutaceae bacterium]|nr:sulfatase [Opitutaceae bacterium]